MARGAWLFAGLGATVRGGCVRAQRSGGSRRRRGPAQGRGSIAAGTGTAMVRDACSRNALRRAE